MAMIRLARAGFAALLLALAAATPALAGAVLDRVLESGRILAVYAPGYAPIAFRDETGALAGFDIEVGEEIARRLGVAFVPVEAGWEAIVAGGWGDRWDIAVGSMTPTAARARVLAFPAVYYYAPAVFAVHKDNARLATLADLNGARIGACSACSYEDYLRGSLVLDAAGAPPVAAQVAAGAVVSFASDEEAFAALAAGPPAPVDAVLTNLPTVLAAIEDGLPFRILGGPVFYEPLALAVAPGDGEFAARIAAIVEAMRADGTLSRLSLKWFNADLTRTK